ncbi:MAG: HlyD family secretion protein, partial [Lachnospiraceae bacterium]|nr:HlyD family secretion protein [Lachnospiraceae bacterium]
MTWAAEVWKTAEDALEEWETAAVRWVTDSKWRHNMANIIEKIKRFPFKVKLIAGTGAACLLLIIIIVVSVISGSEEEVAYKETQVYYGNLVSGVTESGSVDIGTIEQTFDLDMSALERASVSSSSSSSGSQSGMGGMASSALDMFSQIFSMAGGNGSSGQGDDSSLTVSGVCVTVGQQVAVGDALYELEEESVSELEEQLQSNVEKAKADLDAVYADQTLSRESANYTYEISLEYGNYAQTEYNQTISDLEDAVESAEEALENAKTLLANYEAQLEDASNSYEDALQILNNCIYSRDTTDKEDSPGEYVYYFQLAESAQSTADSLESKVDQLTDRVEQAQSNVDTAEKNCNKAKRNLEQGKISALQTLRLKTLAYETAQETYDITIAYLDVEAEEQEETYAEAQDIWDEFSSYISENIVQSQYNGVVTTVELSEGDTISTGQILITLNNQDDVTITVTVDEDDMTDITIGSMANVVFTAYPDDVFSAEVTEISDAETDSNNNVVYDVTATLSGDVSG